MHPAPLHLSIPYFFVPIESSSSLLLSVCYFIRNKLLNFLWDILSCHDLNGLSELILISIEGDVLCFLRDKHINECALSQSHFIEFKSLLSQQINDLRGIAWKELEARDLIFLREQRPCHFIVICEGLFDSLRSIGQRRIRCQIIELNHIVEHLHVLK